MSLTDGARSLDVQLPMVGLVFGMGLTLGDRAWDLDDSGERGGFVHIDVIKVMEESGV